MAENTGTGGDEPFPPGDPHWDPAAFVAHLRPAR
jgi:hypothetical protein